MLFWHLGGTVAVIRYAFRDERMDLRLLLLGAILPDLIDTPVGLFAYGSLGAVRLVAHSLLFASFVMIVVLLRTRRGRPRKRWMPLAIGLFMHLFLDAMWADPETLWWPVGGISFSAAEASGPGAYATGILGDWRVWALEVIGLAYLMAIARRGGLTRSAARRTFLHTGQIDAPIER